MDQEINYFCKISREIKRLFNFVGIFNNLTKLFLDFKTFIRDFHMIGKFRFFLSFLRKDGSSKNLTWRLGVVGEPDHIIVPVPVSHFTIIFGEIATPVGPALTGHECALIRFILRIIIPGVREILFSPKIIPPVKILKERMLLKILLPTAQSLARILGQ